MYRYTVWPGVYSFKDEVALFILYIKEQFTGIVKKIKKTEEAIEEQRLLKRICVKCLVAQVFVKSEVFRSFCFEIDKNVLM